MKNHSESNDKVMSFAIVGVIVIALILGFAPGVLKANSLKPDLMGNLGSAATTAPNCTPSPSPSPGN